ncbi:VanW family protein [Corynebacterium sp.]|uniref:VanW family protein n=1 Tax=Corynebacterium sp. TaxID=1720 RepID=UPI002A9138DB|nr:VanW family protein [Corynebacterium sp.]MDY5786213.1 VanW family protein [Corynebacterium sp.]
MVVGIFAVLLAIYVADLAMNRGNVPRGTTVGGVAIGGMAPQEATAKLRNELGGTAAKPVTVHAAQETARLIPAEAGLGIDWEATVDAAGVESANPITRLGNLFTSREVDAVPTVDDAQLSPQLDRLRAELHRDPLDGAIAIEGAEPVVTDPVPGQEVERATLKDALTRGWLNPDGVEVEPKSVEPAVNDAAIKAALDGPVRSALAGPLTVHGRDGVDGVIAKDQIGEIVQFPTVDGAIVPEINRDRVGEIVGEQLAPTVTEMRNARVLPGGGVEPSVDGTVVDWDVTLEGFDQRLLGDGEREWEAAYKAVPADFTTEQAQNATFDEVVGSFTTGGFSSASGTNIRLVASEVNGAIVNPGETFSLNGYTGPRGTAQGYVESGIILEGRADRAVGGGISQFATTLYNAAYFAGMTDVAHTPHSYYISRYPAGREATVYEGAIDLQFRNDSPYPVKIVTNAGSDSVSVSLMGVKTVNVESINGGRWAATQPQPRTVSGASCAPSGGAPGFTTSDTRVITDLAGNVLSRETQTTVYDPQPIIRCS